MIWHVFLGGYKLKDLYQVFKEFNPFIITLLYLLWFINSIIYIYIYWIWTTKLDGINISNTNTGVVGTSQKPKNNNNNNNNKINVVDEPKNSRHPKGPLDDQSSLNEHLWHDPLHIDGRKDMTVGRIQLNCQKHYNKAFRQPLKASNG